MKRFFASLILLAFVTLFPISKAFAIKVTILGKGGATVNNGNVVVCPNFSLHKCATIQITWQDIKDFFSRKQSDITDQTDYSDYPETTITLYNEFGSVSNVFVRKIVYLDNTLLQQLQPPTEIQGSQILFRGN